MPETESLPSRLTLTRVQRESIRRWRKKLGEHMWALNEAMFDLRVKHRERVKLWSIEQFQWASRELEKLTITVLTVRRSLMRFLKEKRLAAQYRQRLDGAVTGMEIAVGYFRHILPVELRVELPDEPAAQVIFMDRYTKGMKALRAAWTQFFYTTQSRDVRTLRLDAAESAHWHETLDRSGEPPPEMLREFEEMAYEQGVVVHVYDSDNDWIFEAMPLWYAAEDPESLKLRMTLKESRQRKARMTWGRSKPPGDVRSFADSLTVEQKRKVTQILRERGAVPVPELAKEVGWTPAQAFQENPDELHDAREDLALHRAVWSMDLDE